MFKHSRTYGKHIWEHLAIMKIDAIWHLLHMARFMLSSIIKVWLQMKSTCQPISWMQLSKQPWHTLCQYWETMGVCILQSFVLRDPSEFFSFFGFCFCFYLFILIIDKVPCESPSRCSTWYWHPSTSRILCQKDPQPKSVAFPLTSLIYCR